MTMSGKIIFFEEKNFQGRSYECTSSCSEITSHLSQCSSCRVVSGSAMVYDQPNFKGLKHLLTMGEYPEFQNSIGFRDYIRSCHILPVHKGPFKVRIYEKMNFEGQMHELTDDCDSVQERYHMSDMKSCNVMEGYWLMYEQPLYNGKVYYLSPGEYKDLKETSCDDLTFRSIRRIID